MDQQKESDAELDCNAADDHAAEVERWICTARPCPKEGQDRYDRYGIYAGRYCDDHIPWCAQVGPDGEKVDYRDPGSDADYDDGEDW